MSQDWGKKFLIVKIQNKYQEKDLKKCQEKLTFYLSRVQIYTCKSEKLKQHAWVKNIILCMKFFKTNIQPLKL